MSVNEYVKAPQITDLLRYLFMIMIYYTTSTDWLSWGQAITYYRRNYHVLALQSKFIIFFFLIIFRFIVIMTCEIYCYLIMLRLPVDTPDDLLSLLQNFVSFVVVLQFDDLLFDSYLGNFYKKPFKDSYMQIVYRERLNRNPIDKFRDEAKLGSASQELFVLNLT